MVLGLLAASPGLYERFWLHWYFVSNDHNVQRICRRVQPLLELWGTHPVLGPLSHGIYVTVAAGRPDASLLLDVFHLYKSATPFTALQQINGASLHMQLLSPLGVTSKVEQNVVMGPGKPGSVDKGSLEPRGERLLVSTKEKVMSTHFVWELVF